MGLDRRQTLDGFPHLRRAVCARGCIKHHDTPPYLSFFGTDPFAYNNRFRLVEANPDSAVLRAMNITDLTAALVVDNMYDSATDNADLATIEDCKNLGWFNNSNFDGELIEAPQGSDVVRQDEMDALSEEVFTQACFKH